MNAVYTVCALPLQVMLESDGTLFMQALLKACDSHYAARTNTPFYPVLASF